MLNQCTRGREPSGNVQEIDLCHEDLTAVPSTALPRDQWPKRVLLKQRFSNRLKQMTMPVQNIVCRVLPPLLVRSRGLQQKSVPILPSDRESELNWLEKEGTRRYSSIWNRVGPQIEQTSVFGSSVTRSNRGMIVPTGNPTLESAVMAADRLS